MKKIFFILFFALTLISFAYSQGPGPSVPHQFYGNLKYNDNVAVAPGLTIVAKIDNTEVGTSTTQDSRYGYSPNIFFATDLNSDNEGKTVSFYVNGIKTIEEATFSNGAATKLDLTVNANSPSPSSGSSGSSGGGSSGGGGTKITTTTLSTIQASSVVTENPIVTETTLETEETGLEDLTGQAINIPEKGSPYIGWSILIAIIIIGLLVYFYFKKKKS